MAQIGEEKGIDFNPRSREGSDSRSSVLKSFIANFNPRSREGSDSAKLHRLWLKLINTRELLFPKIQFSINFSNFLRETPAIL